MAQFEGSGHSAVPLTELASDPGSLLGWPPEGTDALSPALADWPDLAMDIGAGQRKAWQSRPVLEIDPSNDTGASPSVLIRGLLYLRRYWRYESRVAAQSHAKTSERTEPVTVTPGVDKLHNDAVEIAFEDCPHCGGVLKILACLRYAAAQGIG